MMTLLWYVLSFEAGAIVNFITGYHVVNPGLFRLLSNVIRIDHGVIESNPPLPHTWLFGLPLLLGFHTWSETRLVKDCSFATWLFIGVPALLYFLGLRLRFCVIAAACSARGQTLGWL